MALLARSQRGGNRSQAIGGGSQDASHRLDLAQAVARLAQRAGQLADGALDAVALGGQCAEDPVGAVDELREVLIAAGQLGVQALQRVDEATQLAAAAGHGGRDLGEVAVGRLEPRQNLAQVLPVALQPLACAVEQQLEVVAGVDVERAEELVRVDVGERGRDRHRPALLRQRSRRGPRVQLDEHVLQPGLGPQERRRVLADEVVVLAVERHRDDRAAVLQLGLGDVTDADARHADRLALPWGDGLRGRELGLDLERLVLDEGEPQPLVVEDVPAHRDRDHEQSENREQVAATVLDRANHFETALSETRSLLLRPSSLT